MRWDDEILRGEPPPPKPLTVVWVVMFLAFAIIAMMQV